MAQKLGKVAKKMKNLLPLKKRKRPVIWIKETPQLLDYYHRPTSTSNYPCSCLCSSSSSTTTSRRVQPSAPPLPSWIESDMDWGVPNMKSSSRRPGSGFFGCVMSFTINMLSCFCPCFRITEAP